MTRSVRSVDADCIQASLTEPERFGELYDRHAPMVFRYLRSRLGPDCDDAVGDTFVEAFRQRHRFDPTRGTCAGPWLLGIATNVTERRRADERRWLRRCDAHELPAVDGTDDTDASLDDRRLAPWLRDALRDLRRRDRDALFLHVVGDLSIDEVAAALGVPPGTVKSRLHRARRILAARLEVHR